MNENDFTYFDGMVSERAKLHSSFVFSIRFSLGYSIVVCIVVMVIFVFRVFGTFEWMCRGEGRVRG